MQRAHQFSQTLRSLETVGRKPLWALIAIGLVLLASWMIWLVVAEVPIQVVSRSARVEADEESFPVQSPRSGQVASFEAKLGAKVSEGQLLLKLDDEGERHKLTELEASLRGIEMRIDALSMQRTAQEREMAAAEKAAKASGQQASSEAREAKLLVEQAAEEAARLRAEVEQGVTARSEMKSKLDEVALRRARAETAAIASRRLVLELETKRSGLAADLATLAQELAKLEADRETANARAESIRGELLRTEVRAPYDGVIGEATELRAGRVVSEGEQLATLIPQGQLKIVARFAQAAVGKLRPGQKAHARLDAFPWTEYGSVPAEVLTVATEPNDGSIRVEFVFQQDEIDLPLAHGQTGRVEVEVDRTSPLNLALRAAGFRLDRPGGGR